MKNKNTNPDLLNQVQTAKLLGIKPPVLNRYCRIKFRPALVGKLINIKHPLIIEYMEARAGRQAALGEDPPPYIAKQNKKNRSPQVVDQTIENELPVEQSDNNSTFGDSMTVGGIPFTKLEKLTVREVVIKYGTIAGFKNYVDVLKSMADWKNKEVKFLETRGLLVEMNPFTDTIFNLIDLAFKRVVGEFPNSIAPQLKAIVQGGKDDLLIQMTKLMEKELSKILKSCKSKAVKNIKTRKKQSLII